MVSAAIKPRMSGETESVLLPDCEEMRQMASLLFNSPEAFGFMVGCYTAAKAIIAGEFFIALHGNEQKESELSAGSRDRIAAYRKYWSAMKFEIS